jgi:preprotein translocase subunit SecE
MNRQTKRQMARQGADKPRAPERRSAPNPQVDRTGPVQYFSEVRGEMKKVAWPPRAEILNSSLVVLVGLVVMTSLIFVFDWAAVHVVNFVFK